MIVIDFIFEERDFYQIHNLTLIVCGFIVCNIVVALLCVILLYMYVVGLYR